MRYIAPYIVAALIVLGWEVLAMPEKGKMPERFGIPVSLDPVKRDFPLPGVEVIKRKDAATGELVDTEVRLQRTVYRAHWLESRAGAVSGYYDDGLTCYSLVSDAPYEWAYWSGPNCGYFRFLTLGDGTIYLAWVDFGFVRLARLDESVAPSVALMRKFGALPDPTIVVPTLDIVPRARHWGVNAITPEINIISLEKEGKSGLRLTISNPEGTDKAQLHYDGRKWSLEAPPHTSDE
jgi:hypothetical protein